MIHEADLRELVEFEGQDSPVLSLYLDVDPRRLPPEQYRLVLRNLFDTAAGVDPADRQRVEHFIDLEYDRQARGIACFSCQEQGFWRAYTFNVPIANAIMVDRRPLVRRLVDLLDTYGHLGVVAVDKTGARFFSFHLGSLEEASGMVGEEVKRHKQGGRSAARYQRHEDEAALSNLREVAELTETYARQYQWRRLVLAGTEDNIARFSELLSPPMRQLVVGTTPLELNAGLQDVQARAETIALEARNDYIQQLAQELLVAAAKGDHAVAGLGPTLEALQSGRIHQLLFCEDYTVEGGHVRRCASCNYIGESAEAQCPLCGGVYEPLPDAINTIARRAIAQGAQVTILAPGNPLEAADTHIGAFLRF
ncbi:MAG: hypothetical protein HUU23_02340 [Caldilineales bacterium]|nr:hypothetical protein [Caldilineales bacterium]